jgi:hypothetical protein
MISLLVLLALMHHITCYTDASDAALDILGKTGHSRMVVP